MFTARQQGPYRRLLDAAWAEFCRVAAPLPVDKAAAKDAWYRAELMKAVGLRTTKQAHPRKHYGKLMGHFEVLAKNGIYWQTRLADEKGRNALAELRTIAREFDISEEYVDGTSRQMFGRPPALLTAEQLPKLVMALRIHFKPARAAAKAA